MTFCPLILLISDPFLCLLVLLSIALKTTVIKSFAPAFRLMSVVFCVVPVMVCLIVSFDLCCRIRNLFLVFQAANSVFIVANCKSVFVVLPVPLVVYCMLVALRISVSGLISISLFSPVVLSSPSVSVFTSISLVILSLLTSLLFLVVWFPTG
jgi:hypothetical protein